MLRVANFSPTLIFASACRNHVQGQTALLTGLHLDTVKTKKAQEAAIPRAGFNEMLHAKPTSMVDNTFEPRQKGRKEEQVKKKSLSP